MGSAKTNAPDMPASGDEENIETSPLAFTVQLDDPKLQARKLKIHDKLSSFALKHRRNPSLPDFKGTKASKSLDSSQCGSAVNFKLSNFFGKAGYHSEGYFSSDQDEESLKLRNRNVAVRSKISPVTEVKDFVPHINGASLPNKAKSIHSTRRSSLNDIDVKKLQSEPKLSSTLIKSDSNVNEVEMECDKSDTVSETGTYTVDKEEEIESNKPEQIANETITIDSDEVEQLPQNLKTITPENHKWINDWVKKVAEENFLHPQKEALTSQNSLSNSGSSSTSASKIPSPVNTMPKIREPVVHRRSERLQQPKTNGTHHRRSSSLSAKEFAEHRMSDSSLETESYLRATESVMTAMQNRMKLSLKLNLPGDNGKRGSSKKERIHPPSTASDTDTNSESDSKTFKKPLGTPFTSARLNRAFSLRKARTGQEAEVVDKKKATPPVGPSAADKRAGPVKTSPTTQTSKNKPTATTPFARTDCGRFSMRTTSSTPKTPVTPTAPKKDTKKQGGARSNSSLSSREVEFQNWKRRKSFDPMKAAAEGKKKEMAKKAAIAQSAVSPSMTQSVTLGNALNPRRGNPVLRSASFHSTPQQPNPSFEDMEDDFSPVEEPESPQSSCFSHQPALPPNSPTKMLPSKQGLLARVGISGSRGSLNSAVSEVHSSPSRRARAEFIDNLLVSAIADISIKLKLKSCHLLTKLEAYCEDEDRIAKVRDELVGCDSQRGSAHSSPARKSVARDFPAILKNLKSMENVLQVVEDVLFGEEQSEG